MSKNSIEKAVRDFKEGRFVIVVDDEKRENEGDLVIAASKVTAKAINFMAKEGRGLICVPMEEDRLNDLGLYRMAQLNEDAYETGFTVSVDVKKGTTTGISASDRAKTIKALINPKTRPEDLAKPGHIFPLAAREGGVLVRAGHTEAAVDLAKLAGLYPAGVIVEIMNEDGTMARLPDLKKFAARHELAILAIGDLIEYRKSREKLIRKVAQADLPTELGDFKLSMYESKMDNYQHLALVKGKVRGKKNVLVRVHSECLTGDIFRSLRCDCGRQLAESMRMIEKSGCGVLLYMRQEGRGIGLKNKLHAYELQERGADTVEANERLGFPADLRDYGIGAQILADLGLTSIVLITNNPRKVVGLGGYGLKISRTVPVRIPPNPHNRKYIETKRERMGHDL